MRRTVTGAPYSAVEVTTEQQALAGGNQIQRQHQTTIYRDGQGRMRLETEVTRPNGSGVQTQSRRVTISDPVAGYVHELDPQNKTADSMPTRGGGPGGRGRIPNGNAPQPNIAGPAGNGRGMRNPNNTTRQADPNVQTESLGTQTINGVTATGTRVTRTIPAGSIGNAQTMQVIHETWISDDLQVPIMVKTTDPRFGTRVTQLTNIQRGEPDSTLFQVPADYTVRRGGAGRGPRPIAGGQIN